MPPAPRIPWRAPPRPPLRRHGTGAQAPATLHNTGLGRMRAVHRCASYLSKQTAHHNQTDKHRLSTGARAARACMFSRTLLHGLRGGTARPPPASLRPITVRKALLAEPLDPAFHLGRVRDTATLAHEILEALMATEEGSTGPRVHGHAVDPRDVAGRHGTAQTEAGEESHGTRAPGRWWTGADEHGGGSPNQDLGQEIGTMNYPASRTWASNHSQVCYTVVVWVGGRVEGKDHGMCCK